MSERHCPVCGSELTHIHGSNYDCNRCWATYSIDEIGTYVKVR